MASYIYSSYILNNQYVRKLGVLLVEDILKKKYPISVQNIYSGFQKDTSIPM